MTSAPLERYTEELSKSGYRRRCVAYCFRTYIPEEDIQGPDFDAGMKFFSSCLLPIILDPVPEGT